MGGGFNAVVELSSRTLEGGGRALRRHSAIVPLPGGPGGRDTHKRPSGGGGAARLGSVEAALDALTSGLTPDAVLTGAEDALSALGELTGRTVREDVVDRIFERYCVGK